MRTPMSTALFAITLLACGGDDADDGNADTGTSNAETTTNGDSLTVGMTLDGSISESMPMTTAEGSTSDGESTTGTTAVDESTDTTAAGESTDETTAPVEFSLTSPSFVEGGGIPGEHHIQGGNISPQLDWVGAPANTMSFAVFFEDITIDFEHSAIWNISADATGLPEDVDHDAMPADVPGAVQCENWAGDFGYGGPGSQANFYMFTLYALDVAEVPGIDSSSSLVEVHEALEAHAIATATLTGQSTGP